MTETKTIGNIRCRIASRGNGGPVLFWLNSPEFGERFGNAVGSLEEKTDKPFVLLQPEFPSWNNDFSPWHMSAGDTEFGNGGSETLRWIAECGIPFAKKQYPESGKYAVCGYSLAGLFSLWAFYENGIFDGAACCSGSLWFEGWDCYADGRKPPGNRIVYLSLGGKEPGSGNAFTKTVGTAYARQRERLKRDGIATVFENNPGGHFSDPAGRMVKSFIWLIDNL